MRKYSHETIYRIRRLRQARRLFRSVPLFAYELMKQEHPGYSYELFIQDITPRKSKQRYRHVKNHLSRYGRYFEMRRMAVLYEQTGNPLHGLKADQLRKYLTQPYRVRLKIDSEIRELNYPPTYSLPFIQNLIEKASGCNSWVQFEEMEKELRRYGAR